MKKKVILAIVLALLTSFAMLACGQKQPDAYTITFDSMLGTEVEAITWKNGDTMHEPVSERSGYELEGWYYDIDQTKKVDFAQFSVSKSTTLFARWIKIFYVDFETNGGNEINQEKFYAGDVVTLPTPEKEHGTFGGWYFDQNFQTPANFENVTTDVTVYAKWVMEREIRLYHSETEYVSIYRTEGETVSIADFGTPDPIVFRGLECDFSHWVDEQLDDIIDSDFVMPLKSLAFYAKYEDVPMANNFYLMDPDENGNYTAFEPTSANAMMTIPDMGGQYGRFEVDMTVTNRSLGRVAIMINANVPDGHKYGDQAYSIFMYHNLAANSRFAILSYYNDYRGYELAIGKTSVDWRNVSYGTSTNSALVAYRERNAAFLAGETDSVTVRLGLESMPGAINMYVDGVLIGTYTGEYADALTKGPTLAGLGDPVATGVGFTASATGVIFSNPAYISAIKVTCVPDDGSEAQYAYVKKGESLSNASFDFGDKKVVGWYADESMTTPCDMSQTLTEDVTVWVDVLEAEQYNNFLVYQEGGKTVYEATVAKAMTTVPGIGGKYGRFEVDIEITNRDLGGMSLLINAAVGQNVLFGGGPASGFSMYHNASANARFAIMSYYNAYRGYEPAIGETASDWLNHAYNGNTTNAALKAYHTRSAAFHAGETDVFTATLGYESLPGCLNMYIDGVLIASYTGKYADVFSSGATKNGVTVPAQTGVGFYTSATGIRFIDPRYVPASEVTFKFSDNSIEDKKFYVSAGQPLNPDSVNLGQYEVEGFFSDASCTTPLPTGYVPAANATIYVKVSSVRFVNGYKATGSGATLTYEQVSSGNCIACIPDFGAAYGTYEATITAPSGTMSRVGILANASIPVGAVYDTAGSGYGYYLHHSLTANTRFVLIDYNNGYSANIAEQASVTYAKSGAYTHSSTNGGLKKYFDDNVAIKANQISQLVFTEKIEVTPTAIKYYINDELVGTTTNDIFLKAYTVGATFTSKASGNPTVTTTPGTGLGFLSNTVGTKFSNFKFTPYVQA